MDPEDVEVPLFYHYLNGHAVYEFPGDFVMTGHVHILPYTPWAPKVSCSSPPVGLQALPWDQLHLRATHGIDCLLNPFIPHRQQC